MRKETDLDVSIGFSNEKQEHSNMDFNEKNKMLVAIPRLSHGLWPMRLLYAFSEELEKYIPYHH